MCGCRCVDREEQQLTFDILSIRFGIGVSNSEDYDVGINKKSYFL